MLNHLPIMINLWFGLPEHGWLPVEFKAGDYELELDVSDVPVNPLDELCSALIIVLQGGAAEMGWHLEPTWYYFRFEPSNEVITLVILKSERYGSKTNERFRVTGTFESLLLPICRALKSFATTDYGIDWPTVDSARIKQLTELIKARKQHK